LFALNYSFLEMLYNIPELQTLSYQLYMQMPERILREEHLAEVWRECKAVSDADIQELFGRLEDAIYFDNDLQERAAFFSGLYCGWGLSRTMGG